MWYGLSDSNLTGPRVIEGRVTGPYYRNFLGNELPLYLEDMPLTRRRRMCQRHEMESPHFGTEETEFLNKNYEGRWTGKQRPVV
jgi:hypothetical protein